MEQVLESIRAERKRQDLKWGSQRDHRDGTTTAFRLTAELFRRECDDAFSAGFGTWRHILLEEVFEALAETDPVALRAELVQVAAVATCWVEALDARD